jgi:hypothetical protein
MMDLYLHMPEAHQCTRTAAATTFHCHAARPGRGAPLGCQSGQRRGRAGCVAWGQPWSSRRRQESTVLHGLDLLASCASPPGQPLCPPHLLAHPAAATRHEWRWKPAYRWWRRRRRRDGRSCSHPWCPDKLAEGPGNMPHARHSVGCSLPTCSTT